MQNDSFHYHNFSHLGQQHLESLEELQNYIILSSFKLARY